MVEYNSNHVRLSTNYPKHAVKSRTHDISYHTNTYTNHIEQPATVKAKFHYASWFGVGSKLV